MRGEIPPPDARLGGLVKVVQLSAQRDMLRVASQSNIVATVALGVAVRSRHSARKHRMALAWPDRPWKTRLHRWRTGHRKEPTDRRYDRCGDDGRYVAVRRRSGTDRKCY